MTINRHPVVAPSALLLALAAALAAGCAPAQFAHQRTVTRTEAALEQAAVAARDELRRPAIPALTQPSLADPPVALNEPRQTSSETPAPAPPLTRDVAVQRIADAGPRTVQRVSTATFDQHVLASDVPVLVDFYADWCGPCRTLAPTLDQVAAENPQVRVVKVNIDDSPELAARYGVRSVPRLMVFKDGQIAAQQSGVASKSRLTAMLGLSAPGLLD